MSEKQGFIRRFFSKCWSIINTSRQVFINIIFVLFIILIISALTDDSDEVTIPESAVLILNMSGDVVEQKKDIDPAQAFIAEATDQPQDNPEVLLSDILDVIESAKNDNRIKVMVLQLKGLGSAGLTKLRYIGDALTDFKESGKRIIAVGDGYSQDQYYLASYADDVWLTPGGWLILDGYGRYQMYFKSALEKLNITQHVFRVGTFKSAVEPYIRNDMSDEAKLANEQWLNDLWTVYKTDVAKQREFKLDNFDETFDAIVAKLEKADGDFSQYALDNNFVDALKTREEVRTELAGIVGKTETGSYHHIGFNDYLKSIKPPFPMVNPITDKVAIVVAKGTILDGHKSPGTIGGDSTAALLRKARLNDKVKAVVLRVDSPGGSAYASEIIRQEVELLRAAGKPVIASMGTYAASGGYWISASANEIYASPTTITGSIGIFGMFMTFEKTLEKLGVYTDGVGTTELAGMSLARPLKDGMGQVIQLNINKGYKNFLELVAENRNMTVEEVDQIAQGRVWTGAKAQELGLVDKLGDLTDAVVAAANLAGLQQYDTLLVEKELSAKEIFLRNMFGQAATWVGTDAVSSHSTNTINTLVKQVVGEIDELNQLNDPQGIYTLCLTCEIK